MRRAFGDSFLFIALLNPRDSFHQIAVEVTRDWEGQILTTRWVLAEVGNALCGVNARQSFVTFLEGLTEQEQIMVLPDSDNLFNQGTKLFSNRPDKEWSLTDCISFAAMRACALEQALTGDHHFEQAGFKALLKLPV
jgi:uncharacterized protein